MSKRGNGEGSIYQRGDGRWVAAVTLESGARTSVYGKTRREVDDKLSVLRTAQSHGLPVVQDRKTLDAYVPDWLEATRPSIRARTWRRYEQLLRVHVLPELGRIPLARLEPAQLQRLYTRKLEAGLSSTTVHHIHAAIHRALAQATRWGLVARNVASLVDAPSINSREMSVLTEEQVRSFLDAAAGEHLESLFVIATTTGMRQSEILGLRWRDVDLEKAEIKLRTTLERYHGEVTFAEPKTKGSRRCISLTRAAVAALRTQRIRQAEHRLAAGTAWTDRDLVFTNPVGEPVAGSTLQRALRAILERAKLPRIRFHDLRHTAATMLLGRGVHPKIASEMLGHSRIAVTLDLYSHVTPTMQREAVSAIEAALGR